jgi:dihydrofolate reductase
MSSVIWHVTMSVDGFIAGPDDSMDWVFAQWTDDTGEPGDIRVDKSSMADEIVHTTGAILAGRRWYEIATSRFNGVDGIYGGAWKGPVFVLTHRPPESGHHPAVSFVSEDVRDAVATARDAAQGRNIVLFGANIPQQCLRAGVLDELIIHLVPVLLGDGIRLFDTPGLGPVALRRTAVGESGQITDLRFRVAR